MKTAPLTTKRVLAGWPRAVARPGLPQIRTCAIRASGSSCHGFARPERLSVVVSCRWSRGPVSPPSVPRTVPWHGIPFPPPGLPQARIPRLRRYYGMLRIPAARPAALRCLRLAVPHACRFVRSCGLPGTGPPAGRGSLVTRTPPCPGFSCGDDRASQVPGGPACTCPALRPRRDLRARPMRRVDAAFRLWYGVGSRGFGSYGAQSHGPCIRCLRFAGRITPPPRKTRFWLLARLCQAGLVTRWVPTKGFSMSHNIPSSFPRLSLAQTKRSHPAGNGL